MKKIASFKCWCWRAVQENEITPLLFLIIQHQTRVQWRGLRLAEHKYPSSSNKQLAKQEAKKAQQKMEALSRISFLTNYTRSHFPIFSPLPHTQKPLSKKTSPASLLRTSTRPGQPPSFALFCDASYACHWIPTSAFVFLFSPYLTS